MKHSGLMAMQTLSILAGYHPEIKKLLDKVNEGKMTPMEALNKARIIEAANKKDKNA